MFNLYQWWGSHWVGGFMTETIGGWKDLWGMLGLEDLEHYWSDQNDLGIEGWSIGKTMFWSHKLCLIVCNNVPVDMVLRVSFLLPLCFCLFTFPLLCCFLHVANETTDVSWFHPNKRASKTCTFGFVWRWWMPKVCHFHGWKWWPSHWILVVLSCSDTSNLDSSFFLENPDENPIISDLF